MTKSISFHLFISLKSHALPCGTVPNEAWALSLDTGLIAVGPNRHAHLRADTIARLASSLKATKNLRKILRGQLKVIPIPQPQVGAV